MAEAVTRPLQGTVVGVAEEEEVITELEVDRVIVVRAREATVVMLATVTMAEQQSEAEAGEGLGVAGPGGGATLRLLCSTSLLELVIIEWTNQGPLMV